MVNHNDAIEYDILHRNNQLIKLKLRFILIKLLLL